MPKVQSNRFPTEPDLNDVTYVTTLMQLRSSARLLCGQLSWRIGQFGVPSRVTFFALPVAYFICAVAAIELTGQARNIAALWVSTSILVVALLSQTTLALASKLGLSITAEGVETSDELDLLRSEGCGEVQGYYVGRPAPAHQVTSTIRNFDIQCRLIARTQ